MAVNDYIELIEKLESVFTTSPRNSEGANHRAMSEALKAVHGSELKGEEKQARGV